MTAKKTLLFAGSGALVLATLVAVAVLIGPAKANKTPVTPEQLQAYDEVFLEEVRTGDLLFHGDDATAKKLGVKLTTSAMACAMCHPYASDTHPQAFPKFQVSMNKFATLRDMINWCIEHPVRGKVLAPDDPKMRALESYILAQRKGVPLDYGKR